MKYELFLGILFLSCVHTLERGDLERYGSFQLLVNSDFLPCSFDKTLNINVSEVDVYFYDLPKDGVKHFKIHEAANGILAIPDLDISRRFIFYLGGTTSNITSNSIDLMRDAFRDVPNCNCYFIVLTYTQYTLDPKTNKQDYKRAVPNSFYIGKAFAGVLTVLNKRQIPARNMHCIGYSLGGQILGYTGEIFYQNTGDKLNRITALDPAGPCFSKSSIKEQVRSGVGEYVEVYHCNAGGYGSDSVLGDIDFFLNKRGSTQPNCGTPFIPNYPQSSRAALCNHITCVDVWASTVRHRDWFTAYKCDSYNKFKNGYCEGNNTTRAGFWNPGTEKGTYYFYTDDYDSAL